MSQQLTIKENIAKLELLMQWFDGDEFEIEESIAKFEEAKKLADEIKKQLKEVENKITVLKQSVDE